MRAVALAERGGGPALPASPSARRRCPAPRTARSRGPPPASLPVLAGRYGTGQLTRCRPPTSLPRGPRSEANRWLWTPPLIT